MSEPKLEKPEKPEKPQKMPPWWIPIIFAALVGWLLNNFITIGTFLITGVVQLSHVGVAPFLLALGLSVLFGLVGFILGIRLCVYLALSLIASIVKSISEHSKQSRTFDFSQPLSSSEPLPTPASRIQQPPESPTRWDNLRETVFTIAGTTIMWLLVPKRFRRW